MKNPCLEAALDELDKAGIRDVVRAHGSKHLQLRFKSNGYERMCVIPVSPSDVRSAINTRAQVRKILREDGVLVTAERRSAPTKAPDRVVRLEQRVAALEQQLAVLSKQMNGAS